MNTPLILMTAAFALVIVTWLMARSDAIRWERRYKSMKADRDKLLTTHLNTLGKLWALQEAEQRRSDQRLAALDKANAANRARRMVRLCAMNDRGYVSISEGIGAASKKPRQIVIRKLWLP